MKPLLTALLASAAVLAPVPAMAQAVDSADIQRQLATMQAEIARLTAQLADLQAREAQRAVPAPVAVAATTPSAAPAAAAIASAASTTQIAWKGAPELTAPGGWSFKPRGRLQVDTAVIDAPDDISGSSSLGVSTEFRRAYLGFEGTLPGNFGYRLEADFANSAVDLTDVYLTY
ncbi:MAG: porin, partial [Croceibacterium sp.]